MKTKLIHDTTLISRLSSSHLILDTNVFLHAVNNEEFYNLLLDLHDAGCTLLTIPSVVFEFARGAKSVEEFNRYVDFVNSLGVITYGNAENLIMADRALLLSMKVAYKLKRCTEIHHQNLKNLFRRKQLNA